MGDWGKEAEITIRLAVRTRENHSQSVAMQARDDGSSGLHQRGFRLESCLVGDLPPLAALCGRAGGADLRPEAVGFLWSALCCAFSAFSCLGASCL